MRSARLLAIAFAALSASVSLTTLSAQAEEYEGFAAFDGDATNPLALPLAGGSFSATVYEDKAKACSGGNKSFADLRQAVLNTTTRWVRVSYKECKQDFALVCIDTDLNAKGAPPACTAITTQAPPEPNIIETYSGAVTSAVSDDAENPTISLSGSIFNVIVKPDTKNVCKGNDNFAAVKRLLQTVKEDQSVRVTFKSCTAEQGLMCIDLGLTGAFKPRVCASVVRESNDN